MRKILALLSALTLLAAVGAWFAQPASATEQHTYKVIAWEMPSWNGNTPVWPQSFFSVVETHSTQGALALAVLPDDDCGYFQIDVYKYDSEADRAAVDYLVSHGVLTSPNHPTEPLISGGLGTAWKFVNLGACETATPTPTPTETSETPTPTPTETSQTPTPTPTETSETPSPTPTQTSSTPTPTHSTTPPSTPSPTPTTPTLAKTGSAVTWLGLLALLALAGGAALVTVGRRGKHS
jgi:LPXTG-motif cell wall-anchored protein